MSKPLALFCLAALSAASLALWLHQAITRACSWTCPCDGGQR